MAGEHEGLGFRVEGCRPGLGNQIAQDSSWNRFSWRSPRTGTNTRQRKRENYNRSAITKNSCNLPYCSQIAIAVPKCALQPVLQLLYPVFDVIPQPLF